MASSLDNFRWNGLLPVTDAQQNSQKPWTALMAATNIGDLMKRGTSIGGIWTLPVCQVPSSSVDTHPDQRTTIMKADGFVPCHCTFADGSDSTDAFRVSLCF